MTGTVVDARRPMASRPGVWLPVATLALAVLLPIAVLLGSAFLLGLRFQPLESASMAPSHPLGALAVVQPIDGSAVEAGMVIVFVDPADPSRLVAHRAVKPLPADPPAWQTRGDANDAPDAYPVPASAVRGRIAWSVPGLGTLVTVTRGAPAVILLVALPLAALVLSEARDRRRRRRAPALA